MSNYQGKTLILLTKKSRCPNQKPRKCLNISVKQTFAQKLLKSGSGNKNQFFAHDVLT